MKKKILIICSFCAALLLAFCIFFILEKSQKPNGIYTVDISNGAYDIRHTYIIYTDGTYDSLSKILGADTLYSGTWKLENNIIKFEEFNGNQIYSGHSGGEYIYDETSDSFKYKREETYAIWRNTNSGSWDNEKCVFIFK